MWEGRVLVNQVANTVSSSLHTYSTPHISGCRYAGPTPMPADISMGTIVYSVPRLSRTVTDEEVVSSMHEYASEYLLEELSVHPCCVQVIKGAGCNFPDKRSLPCIAASKQST